MPTNPKINTLNVNGDAYDLEDSSAVKTVTVNSVTYSPTSGDVDLGTIGGGGTVIYDGDSTTDTSYDNLFAVTVGTGLSAVSVGLDMDLLWENEDTTITFAPQTIQLSLADYKYLFIKFINAKGGNGKYNLIATMGERFFAGVMSYSAKMEYRAFTTSNSGIEFEKGQLIGTYGSTSSIDNNDCMIPYQIYGIRGKINDLTGD